MQCFQLPTKVTNQLDRINREFFWKKSDSERGLKLIAWDKVCRPKTLGGLGLRKTGAINKAFQGKLAWKVMTAEDNIWVRIMRAKYLKTHTFLACPPKATDSPVWKSSLKSRKLIRQGIVWKVATGETI